MKAKSAFDATHVSAGAMLRMKTALRKHLPLAARHWHSRRLGFRRYRLARIARGPNVRKGSKAAV